MVRLLIAVWTAITARRGYDRPRLTPMQLTLAHSHFAHRERVWAWQAKKEAPLTSGTVRGQGKRSGKSS